MEYSSGLNIYFITTILYSFNLSTIRSFTLRRRAMHGSIAEITNWFSWFFTILYAGCTLFVYLIMKRESSRIIKLIGLMAMCYPLGKLIEIWLIGPDFIRWHLSDFGFVPCLAFVLYKIGALRRLEPWRQWLIWATAPLVAAVGAESVELALQRVEVARNLSTRGAW